MSQGWMEQRLRLFEKRVIERLLRKTQGSVTEAARLAGRNRTYFSKQCTYYGIDPRDYKHRPALTRVVKERAVAVDRVSARVTPRERRTYFGVSVE